MTAAVEASAAFCTIEIETEIAVADGDPVALAEILCTLDTLAYRVDRCRDEIEDRLVQLDADVRLPGLDCKIIRVPLATWTDWPTAAWTAYEPTVYGMQGSRQRSIAKSVDADGPGWQFRNTLEYRECRDARKGYGVVVRRTKQDALPDGLF